MVFMEIFAYVARAINPAKFGEYKNHLILVKLV